MKSSHKIFLIILTTIIGTVIVVAEIFVWKNGLLKQRFSEKAPISTDAQKNGTENDSNIIYDDTNKYELGFKKDDKLNIYLGGGTASFAGNADKLRFLIPESSSFYYPIKAFRYDDLEIASEIRRPYGGEEVISTISYKCDGPFLKEEIYYNCQTNGVDFLSQDEFSDVAPTSLVTGGGTERKWRKFYAKRFNGVDIIFIGELDGEYADPTEPDYQNRYKVLATKDYLDTILQKKENIEKISKWEEFINGLKFTEQAKSAEDETASWKTYKDEKNGAEFKYPESFGANVWGAYSWPPKLMVVSEEQDPLRVGCPDLPSNISSVPVEINGLDYIFYEASEGAAGSTYTTYCYITKKDKNYYVFNFLIRTTSGCGTNCGPYCETQFETECKNLDIVNAIDKPIEKIVSTLKFAE